MKRRGVRFFAILALALVVLPATLRAAPPPTWPTALTIGTASPGGVFLLYGQAMAKILTEALGIPVTAQVTQGSSQNLLLLENGTIQLGLVSTDVALDGWNGTAPWSQHKKLQSARALLPMYDSPLVIAALKSANMRSLPDMAGRRIAVGPQSSAAAIVLKAFDTLAIKATWRYGAYDTLSKQMQSGSVDALVSTIASPAPVLKELDATGQVRFVPIGADEIARLCAALPQFSPSVVARGTYPSLTADYATVGWFNFVFVGKDLPDDLVYAIVKAFYANRDRMIQGHASARESVVANAKRNTSLPFHPSAVRYYREAGIVLPDNLTKPE